MLEMDLKKTWLRSKPPGPSDDDDVLLCIVDQEKLFDFESLEMEVFGKESKCLLLYKSMGEIDESLTR